MAASKRILLMYISQVSGHRQATIAIENALHRLDPTVETRNINLFHYTSPITEKVIHRLYLSVLKRLPGIWDFLYDNPRVVRASRYIKKFIHTHHSPKLKRLFDDFMPDMIVCSQAYPCGMVADFKKIYAMNAPLVAVLTDYVPHSFWLYDNVDFYISPHESIKDQLIQKGIIADRIKTYGIPIDPKFSNPVDPRSVAKKLCIDDKLPTILVMGGGHGLGPIKEIITSLDETVAASNILVVSGINKKLLTWITAFKKNARSNILGFGFVDNIEEMMAISQLVITKPGGITTAEALALGLPMVIVAPLPGQEEHNTHFLLKLEAAKIVKDPALTGSTVRELLHNPEELRRMRSAAKKLAHPDSALDIAKLLLAGAPRG